MVYGPIEGDTARLVVVIIYTILAGGAAYFESFHVYRKWLHNRDLIFKYYIDDIIRTLAQKLHLSKAQMQSLRSNVMLVKKDFLGRANKFKIIYRYNMDQDPDYDLELLIMQGVCGDAFNERKICFAGPNDLLRTGYNLSPEQKDKTRHIQTIVCVPVWDFWANHKKKYITAILSVDSKMDLSQLLLNEKIFEWLKARSDFLGLMDIY